MFSAKKQKNLLLKDYFIIKLIKSQDDFKY